MTVTTKGRAEPASMAEFDYPWIRAWGAYSDAIRVMIEQMLTKARQEEAPSTVLWYYPETEVADNHWDESLDRWIPNRLIPAHWEDLADLMHGRSRQSRITDARIFLWDWGMSRQIHLPDPVLRAWLGEVVLDEPGW